MSDAGDTASLDGWRTADPTTGLERYSRLVNTLDDAIYQLDADGCFVAVNDAVVETTGYDRDTLLGEHVSMLVAEEDVARLECEIRSRLKTGEDDSTTFDMIVRTADGQSIPCETRFNLLQTDGTFEGTVGVVRPVESTDHHDQLGSVWSAYESVSAVVDEADVGVFVLDETFQVAWADETIEQYFGIDRTDVIGRDKRTILEETVRERIAEPDDFVDRILAAYDDNSDVDRFECRISPGTDRSERWLEHRSTPIESGSYAGGRVELYYDITDRKQSEVSLRATEQRLHSLVDAVEEYAIFGLDPHGNVVSWNEGARRIKGYDEDEILGEHVSRFYTDRDRAAGIPAENLATAARAGAVEDDGWRVRKDGSRFWANVVITVIRDDDGRIQGYAKVTRDMTEQREYERELEYRRRMAEDELAAVFDRVSDAFFALDEDFRFTHVNEHAKAILDQPETDLLGEKFLSVLPEAAPTEAIRDQFERAFQTQETQTVERYVDAIDRWIDATIYPSESGLSVYFRDVTDRIERERERRRSERRYRTLAEQFPNGTVTMFDEDLRYTLAAGQGFDEIGIDPTELEGRTLREAYDERVVNVLEPAYHDALDGTERTVELASHDRIWLVHAVPVVDEDGAVSGGMSMAQDVTERIERERELRQYETIIETIDDGIYVVDENGYFTLVNDAYETMTGYDRDELLGSHVSLVVDESVHQQATQLSKRLSADDAPTIDRPDESTDDITIEADIRTKSGDAVPAEATFALLPEDDEQQRVGVVRDITARRNARQTLERRARQQRIVAELGQFALEGDDLDRLMEEATRQVATALDNEYCKVLDFDPVSEHLRLRQGVGWRDGIVGTATVDANESSQAGYTLHSDGPVVVDDLESETRFSGPELLTSHDVSSGISTIIGSDEDPWGILGTHDTEQRSFSAEDVDFVQSVANVLTEAIERQRYQRELEELIEDLATSNERLEQFAYAASHDLQEPLRMVSSYLQLIERRYGDALDEDGEEFLEFAVDGAQRMKDMIDGLLTYSRVETQGEPLDPVDLDVVFEEVCTDLQVMIDDHDAAISADSLPVVDGDPSQLRQVFQNLLVNAIEHSGDEPAIVHVAAERNGPMWTISVRDDGVGIESSETDYIFDIFQSGSGGDGTTGAGIGLAVCERIVERHGGEIWVESTPGDGSTFYFTLPASIGQPS